MPYSSTYRPGLFDNRTIIVTGGGSGIGRCTAHELASLGAAVALVGRDANKLATVRAEIEADGGRATTHVCDIRDDTRVATTIEEIVTLHGRIDGLFNNAGGQYRSDLRSMTTKGFEAVVRTNLTGGFVMMREVYTRWMEEHGGAIVNMVIDFWHGRPGAGHSAAARAGMATLSETAASEWAHAGVRVNCIAPGFIASSGLDRYSEKDRAYLSAATSKIPLGRFGTVSEVSAAVVYLLSPAAAYVTGTTIRIDGGTLNVRTSSTVVPHDRSQPFDGFHRSARPDVMGDLDERQSP